MPDFRVLSPEQAARYQGRRGRSVDLTEYLQHLESLEAGQLGEAALDGEKKSTVKRRLTSAAKQLGKKLKYRRSGEQTVVYEVAG